jgi:outer membrane protein assembly factor BamB
MKRFLREKWDIIIWGIRKMKPLWWKLSIIMIFVIVCSPCVNSSFVNKINKSSYDQHGVIIPGYMNDWYVDKNSSIHETETYTPGLQLEGATIVKPYGNQADGERDGPMDSPWSMFGHDVVHTCLSSFSTENNSGAEIWRVRGVETGAVESSAIINNDGIIYFGTKGADGALYALYPNGTLKWRYVIDGIIWDTPAIADDGTLYFTTWGGYGYLYAIHPNGTLRWLFNDGYDSDSSSSPVIGGDGTIYFGSDFKKIYAVNPNGTEKWRYTTGYIVMGSPAIGNDGTIYIGSGDHYLYALNPDGTLYWRFGTGGEIKGSVSIASDGTIYVPSFGGYFYALYPNGTMKWKASTGGVIAAAGVALAEDGTIYVGTEQLRAYYPNGTLKWVTDVQGSVYGTVPAVSADGTIYVSAGGSLVAVNPDGTERWRKQLTTAQICSSPSIGPDDRVYVGSEDYGLFVYGYLHAFGLGLLRAEAGGPYSGLASDTPMQFSGLAFGGVPPYTYLWDFGDGNISTEQNPSHLYRDVGIYNITFTITDDDGNISNDTTTATLTYGPPTVWYIKPEQALYIANIRICKFPSTLILGKITIQADASHPLIGIDHIEFYLDFELQAVDNTPPYTWMWNTRYPLRAEHTHRIIIKAITTQGTVATLGYQVDKYF